MKFMFDSFEEYAEIMQIPRSHSQWEAFQLVWRMARSPAFPDTEEEKDSKKDKWQNPITKEWE